MKSSMPSLASRVSHVAAMWLALIVIAIVAGRRPLHSNQ